MIEYPLSAFDPDEDEPDRSVGVTAVYHGPTWEAHVLHDVNGASPWITTWTDGINTWFERFDEPWHALARLAALVAAVEQEVFLVHDWVVKPDDRDLFVAEAERFVSRTVHASSCQPDCDGTDPANHQV